jgi:hypothetical protein
MNKIFIMLTMGLIASGCAGKDPINGDSDPEIKCQDRNVTVLHARGFLTAHPEYIVVCPGQRILIKVVPPVDPGQARTMAGGENQEARWLNSTNKQDRHRTIIQIPDAKDVEEGEYKYSITIDGVGTLDPRVRVSKNIAGSP